MSQLLRVGISEFHVASAPDVLVSYGLGSCLAIAIYDPEARIGALAHTLLGDLHPGLGASAPGKFVETAIPAMLGALQEAGAAPERLVAKLCGGAHMFRAPDEAPEGTIGQRNAEAAHKHLLRAGIPLVAEDLGGNRGRTVEFELASGNVLVRMIRGHDKLRVL